MVTITPEAAFRAVAPKYMRMFMKDFGASELDAAAVFGNAGYESLGFTTLQEQKPKVKGSRGGWGWFQWTGPRRKAFEAYCARNGYDLASPDANYKFLFVELTSTEKGALPKLKEAETLEDKVKAFEVAFERAGVKAYPKRNAWAKIALDALRTTEPEQPTPKPLPIEDHEDPIAPPPEDKRPNWAGPIALVVAIVVIGGVLIFFGG